MNVTKCVHIKIDRMEKQQIQIESDYQREEVTVPLTPLTPLVMAILIER